MEAEPSDVPGLKALHTSDTTITLTWDASLENIEYIRTYTTLRYFDCPCATTGIIAYGADGTIDTKTCQSRPSVPRNFHATWNQNMLTLHFDCPDLPGILSSYSPAI
ncbi:hypothetical protein CBL_09862 [Carabus blaptoides fortunei]